MRGGQGSVNETQSNHCGTQGGSVGIFDVPLLLIQACNVARGQKIPGNYHYRTLSTLSRVQRAGAELITDAVDDAPRRRCSPPQSAPMTPWYNRGFFAGQRSEPGGEPLASAAKPPAGPRARRAGGAGAAPAPSRSARASGEPARAARPRAATVWEREADHGA
jgi:hypothetical protein